MSLQKTHEGPRLSAEGAAILREALDKRAARTRWELPPAEANEDTPHPPVSPERGTRWPWVAGAIAFTGGILICMAVLMGTLQRTPPLRRADPGPIPTAETGLDPIEVEVLGGSVATGDRPQPSTSPDVADDASVPNDGDATSGGEATAVTTALPTVGDVDVQIYAAPERSLQAFALRLRQRGGEDLRTDDLRITLTVDGAEVDADLHFEQADLPADGSAIATVRLDTALAGPGDLVVHHGSEAIASVSLPSSG